MIHGGAFALNRSSMANHEYEDLMRSPHIANSNVG